MKEEHQSLIRETKSLPGEDEVRKTEDLSFRWVYAAALALVALGFLSTTSYYHNDKDASSSLPTLNRQFQYSNADSRVFSYKSVSATPLGIFSTQRTTGRSSSRATRTEPSIAPRTMAPPGPRPRMQSKCQAASTAEYTAWSCHQTARR